ncbi:MAG: DEAD/DEAH box helicase [Chloroflexota bacterium]|nr:DEAD/DEAH box helicase [Chloroflexota bacterium]
MDARVFLSYLLSLPDYRQQMVHTQRIPPQAATSGELDKPLSPTIQALLKSQGILSLHSHQTQAINAISAGKNVMIATPSASGKTLCYHLATLEAIENDRNSYAIYLFPTKALAQDQARSLKEIACPELLAEEAVATFDGDTPQSQRAHIRRQARIVLTNPDMLHLGILPNHRYWSRLFHHLSYVVIDEAHVYRGIFGSHAANVLRRLRRICTLYGSRPQFICSSATIANPGEHAERLVGLPFDAITTDGSPHGEKYFVSWNPPIIDQSRSTRRSSNSEAAFLLSQLTQNDIRSLVFARTRKLTELIYIYAREQLPASCARLLSPYRAGYLPEERREIERKFFKGELLGLVATTALELGINIGDLEATVLTGYPGSIASTWQQAGRSGRSTDSSLSFLIAQDNPLDQYLMRNPEFLFGKNFDNALINPDNPYVLGPHLICAAWEKPIGDEKDFFGDIHKVLTELEQQGRLRKRQQKWYPSPSIIYPAQDVNIRATRQSYAIIDLSRGCLLETVEASVAFFQIHPGAIYLHQGESYIITELDLAQHTALAEPTLRDYYTQTMEITDIRVAKRDREKDCHGVKVYFGDVDVTNQVVGFKKKRQLTEEVLGEEALDLPPQNFPTKALWFDLPQKASDRIAEAGLDYHGGLHACEHAAIGILPLFALCDRNDIGGVSTPLHADTGRAQIFIYDAYPGGIGIAEKGFEIIAQLWQATLKVIRECPCSDGCPSCIQSPKCGNNNQPLDKKAAIILLEELAD